MAISQRTLNQSVVLSGVGLHSGVTVNLQLHPATVDSGIHLRRSDMPDMPATRLTPMSVCDTRLSTNIEVGTSRIGTIEHLLSALSGLAIDNLDVEVSAAEIPILDGSAIEFVNRLQAVGIVEQTASKKALKILKPVSIYDNEKWIRVEPNAATLHPHSTCYQLEIDFDHPAFTEQKIDFEYSLEGYIELVAAARTFGFTKDIAMLQANNLALGGSLDNAIVLDDKAIVNTGGLRYPDEFVRHKLLDLIGDLYTLGHPIIGTISAYKTGHALNNQLLRAILAQPECYCWITLTEDKETKQSPYTTDMAIST